MVFGLSNRNIRKRYGNREEEEQQQQPPYTVEDVDSEVEHARGKNFRTQAIYVRREDEAGAMSWNRRLIHRFSLESPSTDVDVGSGGGGNSDSLNMMSPEEMRNSFTRRRRKSDDSTRPPVSVAKQWRLEAIDCHQTNRRSTHNCILSWCSMGLWKRKQYQSSYSVGSMAIEANLSLARTFHVLFSFDIFELFILSCITFFAIALVFSGLITFAGKLDAQCVRISGAEFNAAGTAFADASALSWTTLSTVGYGTSYPGLSSQSTNGGGCVLINFICALEALVGVLYSGFCGALLFGKIIRAQSKASVTFSDPVLIRYGNGLSSMFRSQKMKPKGKDAQDDGEANENDADDTGIRNPHHCPVLEFRLVNSLFDEAGGEIMDATLNVVANIETGESNMPDASAPSPNDSTHSTGSAWSSNTDQKSMDAVASSLNRLLFRDKSRRLAKTTTVNEETSAQTASRQTFSKVEVEPSYHPFFRRVWIVRHVLDYRSPFLKASVQQRIRRNNGAWPESLYSHAGIRASLEFNQILVSLTGVSNISASQVYGQKIYDFADVNIGYQFVNILYKDDDGVLIVDIDLLNDVREQCGGGGEDLFRAHY